jgi:hypothetical protein
MIQRSLLLFWIQLFQFSAAEEPKRSFRVLNGFSETSSHKQDIWTPGCSATMMLERGEFDHLKTGFTRIWRTQLLFFVGQKNRWNWQLSETRKSLRNSDSGIFWRARQLKLLPNTNCIRLELNNHRVPKVHCQSTLSILHFRPAASKHCVDHCTERGRSGGTSVGCCAESTESTCNHWWSEPQL